MKVLPNLNLSQVIDETNYTFEFIIHKFSENHEYFRLLTFRDEITKIGYEYISEGKGFSSKIYRIFITFANNYVFTCIMKVVSLELWTTGLDESKINLEKIKTNMARTHKTECDFLNYFSDSKFPMPKVYFTDEGNSENLGMILMEDFPESIIVDVYMPFTYAQVYKIIDEIIKFHIYQLNHPTKPWNDKFKFWFISEAVELERTPKMLTELMEFKPEFAPLVNKVIKLFKNINFKKHLHIGCCEELDLPMLVAHGDLWNTNILWKRHNQRVDSFVDFACSFEGNPMYDIGVLLTCTDTAIRRRIEAEFADYYLAMVKDEIPNDVYEKFNKEKLQKAYGYVMVYCLTRFAMFTMIYKNPQDGFTTEEHEKRVSSYLERAKSGLDDSIKFFETYAPSWLK